MGEIESAAATEGSTVGVLVLPLLLFGSFDALCGRSGSLLNVV